MPFAIAMTLVILVSTSVLLYQFWAGSMLHEQTADAAEEPRTFAPPERAGASPLRADHAA